MRKLKDSVVHRSGVTVHRWNRETDACSAWSTIEDLRFRFDIASKGGGRTDIMLTVGKRDLPSLLDEIAQEIPEAMQWMAEAIAKTTHAQRELTRNLESETKAADEAVAAADESALFAYLDGPEVDNPMSEVSDLTSAAQSQ